MKQKIEEVLVEILEEDDVELEHPTDLDNGDFTTNIALQLASKDGGNPREMAEEIVGKIPEIEGVEKVEVAGPGFINFFLSRDYFSQQLKQLQAGDLLAGNNLLEGQKIYFEYTTQNVLKEFHVGHFMSNTVGRAMANLAQANGAEIKRDSYQGDVGMHIAKAVWGMKHIDEELPAEEAPIKEKNEFLGRAYAHGATAFDENASAKAEIIQINSDIYSQADGENVELYQTARQWSLESFTTTDKRIGNEINVAFYESETAVVGKEMALKALDKGILKESDRAIVFEEDGFIPVVFINSEGFPIYAAKDLGLIVYKRKEWPELTKIFVFSANEQNDYFRVVIHVAEQLFDDLERGSFVHIGHGTLKLPEGKMSSRTGDVLSVDTALDFVKAEAIARMSEREMGDIEKDKVAEMVAQAALRFTILKQKIGKNVVFNINQALSFEGDTGPYLQYTAVRCGSVLNKAIRLNTTPAVGKIGEGDLEVARLLDRFAGTVEKAWIDHAPQMLVKFLLELAQEFNNYYTNNKIIDEEDRAQTEHRLALTLAVQHVLTNGLEIMGISVPERM